MHIVYKKKKQFGDNWHLGGTTFHVLYEWYTGMTMKYIFSYHKPIHT